MWYNEYEKNEADAVKVLDWGELLKISQVNKSRKTLMLVQVIGWSVELMSLISVFCRVSSLSQHLLNLQT